MIVKTTRWKQKGFARLLFYIDQDGGEKKQNQRQASFKIAHNFHSSPDDLQGLTEEFQHNDSFRKKRKNGVVLYHEMLSFHPKDRPHLHITVLKDLAERWIEIRGNKAICFAQPHFHGSTPHIHFAFSGNEYKSIKTLRMNDRQFLRYRKEIEAYQKEQYPELKHSLVYGGKKKTKNRIREDKNTRKQKEFHVKHRGEKTHKERLSERLTEIAKCCRNEGEFLQELHKEGIKLYTYRNKTSGILHEGKKYRFKRLGITPELWFIKEQEHVRERIKTTEKDAQQERRMEALEKIQREKKLKKERGKTR